jgi:hypothetical protein
MTCTKALGSYRELPSYDSVDRTHVAYPPRRIVESQHPPSGWVRNEVFDGGGVVARTAAGQNVTSALSRRQGGRQSGALRIKE